MAQIISKGGSLEAELQELKAHSPFRRMWLWVVGILVGFIGEVVIVVSDNYFGIDFVLCMVLAIGSLGFVMLCFVMSLVALFRAAKPLERYGVPYLAQLGILQSGVQGEKIAANTLRQLPENYVVFSNLKVTYEGQTSELDFVAVGPTGVYIIEAKNHDGTVQGDVSDYNLIQQKIGQGGTPYSNTMYNPVKQVGTHVYRLANLLRTNGMNTHVHAAVYFTQANLQLSNHAAITHTPVFSRPHGGDRALRDYITSQMETALSVEEFAKIANFINDLPNS